MKKNNKIIITLLSIISFFKVNSTCPNSPRYMEEMNERVKYFTKKAQEKSIDLAQIRLEVDTIRQKITKIKYVVAPYDKICDPFLRQALLDMTGHVIRPVESESPQAFFDPEGFRELDELPIEVQKSLEGLMNRVPEERLSLFLELNSLEFYLQEFMKLNPNWPEIKSKLEILESEKLKLLAQYPELTIENVYEFCIFKQNYPNLNIKLFMKFLKVRNAENAYDIDRLFRELLHNHKNDLPIEEELQNLKEMGVTIIRRKIRNGRGARSQIGKWSFVLA